MLIYLHILCKLYETASIEIQIQEPRILSIVNWCLICWNGKRLEFKEVYQPVTLVLQYTIRGWLEVKKRKKPQTEFYEYIILSGIKIFNAQVWRGKGHFYASLSLKFNGLNGWGSENTVGNEEVQRGRHHGSFRAAGILHRCHSVSASLHFPLYSVVQLDLPFFPHVGELRW